MVQVVEPLSTMAPPMTPSPFNRAPNYIQALAVLVRRRAPSGMKDLKYMAVNEMTIAED